VSDSRRSSDSIADELGDPGTDFTSIYTGIVLRVVTFQCNYVCIVAIFRHCNSNRPIRINAAGKGLASNVLLPTPFCYVDFLK
jgi:hypothetical protein